MRSTRAPKVLLVLIVATIALTAIAYPQNAEACRCAGQELEEAFEDSSRVVIATQTTEERDDETVFRYQVHAVLKGDTVEEIELVVPGGVSSCWPLLSEGSVGVFFFHDDESIPSKRLDKCRGSGWLENYLRAGKMGELFELTGEGEALDTAKWLAPALDSGNFEHWRHDKEYFEVLYEPLDGNKLRFQGTTTFEFVAKPTGDHPVIVVEAAGRHGDTAFVTLFYKKEGLAIGSVMQRSETGVIEDLFTEAVER